MAFLGGKIKAQVYLDEYAKGHIHRILTFDKAKLSFCDLRDGEFMGLPDQYIKMKLTEEQWLNSPSCRPRHQSFNQGGILPL